MKEENHPRVALGQLCSPVERPETPIAGKEYRQIGVRLWGEGAYEREILEGSKTRYKSLNRVAENDIILNKIWARNGSVAVVPRALEGCYCSSEFPLFTPSPEKMDPRWFHWITKTRWFWDECDIASQGTSGKNRIRPKRFLEIPIPLPSLSVQHHIVASCEKLSIKLEELDHERQKARDLIEKTFPSILAAIFSKLGSVSPCRELMSLVEPDRGISYGIVQTGAQCIEGIPTVRAGNLRQYHVDLTDIKSVEPEIERKYKRTRLKGNELLLRIRGGLGEVAICPRDIVGGNVSREISVIPLLDSVDRTYAMYAISAPASQHYLRSYKRGTSYVGINLKDVRRLMIPVPSMEIQLSVNEYLGSIRNTIDQAVKIQDGTEVEMKQIMLSKLESVFGPTG
jgi:type I restriction enzyme S subunit